MDIIADLLISLNQKPLKPGKRYYMGYSIDIQRDLARLTMSVMYFAQGHIVVEFMASYDETGVMYTDSKLIEATRLTQAHFNAHIIHSKLG